MKEWQGPCRWIPSFDMWGNCEPEQKWSAQDHMASWWLSRFSLSTIPGLFLPPLDQWWWNSMYKENVNILESQIIISDCYFATSGIHICSVPSHSCYMGCKSRALLGSVLGKGVPSSWCLSPRHPHQPSCILCHEHYVSEKQTASCNAWAGGCLTKP